ncbi:hypothetical protein COBT_002846, partial [Conglomerata obtusa]
MTVEYYKNLSQLSKQIINDPYKNINLIADILDTNDDITLLSLLKIFKNIIPLYKIKIIEDKIKHKKEYIKLHNHDKSLYHLYKKFVTRICNIETTVSYKIAVEILSSLDHFNFIEKIIGKIFKGCLRTVEIRKICADGIANKVKTDNVGESTLKILIELMEFMCTDEMYACIADVNIINHLTLEQISPVKKIEKEEKIKKRHLLKNILGKNIEKSSLKSKTDKKLDREMKKLDKKYRTKDKNELENENKKMLKKIVDNLMRIYFIILRDKKENLYCYCIEGLTKYNRFIAPEFNE